MSFYVKIPGQQNPFDLHLKQGESLIVLGANGSGKSAIIDRLCKENIKNVIKIAATRQTWFRTGKLNMTQAQRDSMTQTFESWDRRNESRFFDYGPTDRVHLTLFDVVSTENKRARIIAKAIDSKDDVIIKEALQCAHRDPSIVTKINQIFTSSNMPIKMSIGDADQILASKHNCEPYDIAALSDGERNSLIVAAMVLTSPPETLILIDEPERHLHRSIIVPFIKELIEMRQDCSFVIATHELTLPSELNSPHTLLIRDCTFKNEVPESWDFDYMPSSPEEPNITYDVLKKDIIGSRRKIIFIEGAEGDSLDWPLYSVIFPDISIIPKSGCREVERAVSGLRGTAQYHWVKAFGVIDEDKRDPVKIAELKQKGVYAIKAYSVESIYYHPELQRKAVEKLCEATREDSNQALSNTKEEALKALMEAKDHLCKKVAEKKIRTIIESKMPTKKEVAAGVDYNIPVEIKQVISEEAAFFDELMGGKNLEALICRYPIRESQLITNVVKNLNFANKEQYQGAVRNAIKDDVNVLAFVRNLFGSLYNDIIE